MDLKVTFDQVDPNNGRSQSDDDGSNDVDLDDDSSDGRSQGDMGDLEDLLKKFGFSR